MTGYDDFEEAVRHFDLDITQAPRLDRPLLFFHAGRDEVMPTPKKQADTFMEWASGEKELVYYPDAEHCTVELPRRGVPIHHRLVATTSRSSRS